MISSKKVQEGQSEIISRMLEVKKILDKPAGDRMPFETIQLCHFLSKIAFFKQLSLVESEEFMNVAANASIKELGAGEYFFEEQSESSHMYLILKGSVKVTFNNIVSNLTRSSTFGELEIIFNLPQRVSNAVSVTDSWCILFDRSLVLKLCSDKYKVSEIHGFIERNPYFGALNSEQKIFLATKSQKLKYDEGSYILHVGETPDKVLCVLGGTVSVIKYVTKKQKVYSYEIDVLEEGSIVGEFEALNKIKSEMALYCKSRVSCFLINIGEIEKHTRHLSELFHKNSSTYPDSVEILQMLQEQKSTERFQEREKKYLINSKERLR